MKTVLCDASSLIILHKAVLLSTFIGHYRIVVPAEGYSEIVIEGKTGAERFRAFCAEGIIAVEDGLSFADEAIPLRGGEAGCVLLYNNKRGDFILTDDGAAGDYCRRNRIPYINALLVPKILRCDGVITEDEYMEKSSAIKNLGRYASWVVEYAQTVTRDDLNSFLP